MSAPTTVDLYDQKSNEMREYVPGEYQDFSFSARPQSQRFNFTLVARPEIKYPSFAEKLVTFRYLEDIFSDE